jgi:hypothetical protein
MDEEFSQLEAELKRLRPAKLAPRLTARVALALGAVSAPTRERASRAWGWIALPVAAAGSALLVHLAESRLALPGVGTGAAVAVTAAERPYKPVAAENVLVSASEAELVTLDDGTPARRRRLRFVDTITWRDPRTNASVTWSVPREEVRVVPVVFH